MLTVMVAEQVCVNLVHLRSPFGAVAPVWNW